MFGKLREALFSARRTSHLSHAQPAFGRNQLRRKQLVELNKFALLSKLFSARASDKSKSFRDGRNLIAQRNQKVTDAVQHIAQMMFNSCRGQVPVAQNNPPKGDSCGVVVHARGGRSHIFRLRLRSFSKIFEFEFGSEHFSNLRIRLLYRPRLLHQCNRNSAMFYLRNNTYKDHADSCYCQKWQVTPNLGQVCHKILTQAPDPKGKRRLLPESTPALRIRGHRWCMHIELGKSKLQGRRRRPGNQFCPIHVRISSTSVMKPFSDPQDVHVNNTGTLEKLVPRGDAFYNVLSGSLDIER